MQMFIMVVVVVCYIAGMLLIAVGLFHALAVSTVSMFIFAYGPVWTTTATRGVGSGIICLCVSFVLTRLFTSKS